MAAYHNPEIETSAAESHRELAEAKQRGLGLGLDVTNPNPWGYKSSFEVRRNVTANDISVVRGPCKVSHYSRLVVNSKDLIFNTDAHVGALHGAVKVGLDAGFSRKLNHSQQVIGTRVHRRTVSFKVIPGDTTETSFERELRSAINFDSIKEDEQILKEACETFVRRYAITHYSTAIMLGAIKYQVVSLNQQTSRLRLGLNATAVALAPAAPSAAAQLEQHYTSTKFSKDMQLEKIGKLTDDFSVTEEGVIGIEIAPIDRLVRTPKLADALLQAVQTYCREKLQKRKFHDFPCMRV